MYKETYPNHFKGLGLLHKFSARKWTTPPPRLKTAPQKNDAWKTSPSSLEFFLFRGGRTVQLQGVSIPPCCFVGFLPPHGAVHPRPFLPPRLTFWSAVGEHIRVCFSPLPKLGSFSFKISKTQWKSRGPNLLFLTCFTYDLAPMPPINLSCHQHKTRRS